MLDNLLQGLQKDLVKQVNTATTKIANNLKKKTFSFILQLILFTAAAISLILGFLLFAANYVPIEYVLMLFGGGMLIALLSGAANK